MLQCDSAIEVKNLTKTYKLYDSPLDRLKESINPFGKKYHRDFHALNDVTFKIGKGETVGIVGRNGSGKSTLLKIITGILTPSSGAVSVNGKISALLELGGGFNPELSGLENVYFNTALLGFTRTETDSKIDDILSFADIGDFINQPVKTYSSGMFVRLAFAVAINVTPDILIVDEALAVGDIFFQNKCFAKFKEFKNNGNTILFVTHSLGMITTHCDKALLINNGSLISHGSPKHIVDKYNKLVATKSRATDATANVEAGAYETCYTNDIEWEGLFKLNPDTDSYGNKGAVILEAGIFDVNNSPVQVVVRNSEYIIKVKVKHNVSMPAAIIAFTIKNADGTVLCGTNTHFQNIDMGYRRAGDVSIVTFRQTIVLNPGEYLISFGAHSLENGEYIYNDTKLDYMAFQVTGDGTRHGIFDVNSKIDWHDIGNRL